MNVRRRWWLIISGIIVAAAAIAFILGPVLFASVLYPLPDQYRPSIAKWVPQYCPSVPDAQHLLSALIYTESTWNAKAQSGAGAKGLTQFISSTANAVARQLGVSPFSPNDLINDPDLAIRFGAYYFCTRLDDYGGDVFKTLISYNGGGGAVIAYEQGRPISGTVAYANKIISISRVYKSSYGSWWENADYTSSVAASGDTKSFQVIPNISGFLNTPILDFWRGLLSNPATTAPEATATATPASNNGNLNNFWQNLLPGT